jgi:hypothetical protein
MTDVTELRDRLVWWAQNEEMVDSEYTQHGRDCIAAGELIGELESEIFRLLADAERYRFIRDPCSGAEQAVFYRVDKEGFGLRLKSGEMLDIAIDDAMKEPQP